MKKLFFYTLSLVVIVGLTSMKPKPKKKATPKKAATTATTTTPTSTTPVTPVTAQETFSYKFDKTTHDFGNIHEGDQVSTVYVLTNTGKEPIIITSHNVECGCTEPTYTKEPIMPGKSTDIKVGFNSAGKNGAQSKTVKLNTANGTMEVKFTCFVAPKAPIDPQPSGTVNLKK